MNPVSKHDEDLARMHGVALLEIKGGASVCGPDVAAICLWNGATIRKGHPLWVRAELKAQNIPIALTLKMEKQS